MTHNLLIANTIMSGLMFTLWNRTDLVNIVIKVVFLALLVENVLTLAKG